MNNIVWFIELRDTADKFLWWAGEECPTNWTFDPQKALRFRSEEAAKTYMKLNEDYFKNKVAPMCRISPTEHEFVD